MNNTFTEEEVKRLDDLERAAYRHLYRWIEQWRKYIVFTEGGISRLSSVVGYILGLKHTGQEELAIRMVNDLHRRFEQLGYGADDIELELPDTNERVKVPPRKAVLSDDGCLHSFSFVNFFPVNPIKYNECLIKHRDAINHEQDSGNRLFHDTPHERTVKELNICERANSNSVYGSELTEHKYAGGLARRVYYTQGYNGGLIYHGPGAGQTFSVLVGDGREVLWSIHT